MNTHPQCPDQPEESEPWLTPWPKHQLEVMGQCPICGDHSRETLYDDLIDNTFFCARGRWRMWSCENCSAAYLDPRPTPTSIETAYTSYYTHSPKDATRENAATLSTLGQLRRNLVNGYTNWKFGTHEKDANHLSIPLIALIPSLRNRLAHKYRSIPRAKPKNAVALDLGCGDGVFLETADRCGWNVVGVDPDEKAVKAAKRRGFDVHLGGVDVFEDEEGLFDFITMNHVIEHLHDPFGDLAKCYRLLKPGGRIWIETPNIHSYGHKIFGAHWRGLETPRHLVLFSKKTLHLALQNAGFSTIHQMPDRKVYRGMFEKSHAIRSGKLPDSKTDFPLTLDIMARIASVSGTIFPKRREFITFTAEKR